LWWGFGPDWIDAAIGHLAFKMMAQVLSLLEMVMVSINHLFIRIDTKSFTHYHTRFIFLAPIKFFIFSAEQREAAFQQERQRWAFSHRPSIPPAAASG
jgi:hypothetical protein